MKKIVILFILIYSILDAGECTGDSIDKVEYFAENAMTQVIDKFGGGQDKRIEIIDCKYNSYSGIFKVTASIYWNGRIMRSNNYNIEGIFKFDKNGDNPKFVRSYANKNVKNLEFWGTVAGGMMYLQSLSQDNNR